MFEEGDGEFFFASLILEKLEGVGKKLKGRVQSFGIRPCCLCLSC